MIAPPDPVRALLLDMDGVLVDSRAVHFDAWARLFAEQGIDFGADRFEAEAVGRSREAVIRSVLGQREDRAALMARKAEIVHEILAREGCPAMPGVHELLDEAQRRSLPVAVATASLMPQPFLDAAGLGARLPVVRHRGDVARGKPAPDVFLAAAQALGVPASSCVAVEDSPTGLLAAKAAGCYTIAVPTTTSPEHLTRADAVIPHLRDLWDLLDGA